MAKYYVAIANEAIDWFTVEANSLEEAEEKAKRANSILYADSDTGKYLECGEKEKAFLSSRSIKSEIHDSYDPSGL